MTKRSAKKKKAIPGGGIERFPVGDEIIPRVMVKVSAPFGNAESVEIEKMLTRAGEVGTFDGRIAFAEKWARKNLPSGTLPEKPTAYSSRGWFAGKLLDEIELTRKVIARGETGNAALLAFELGLRASEVFFRFGHGKNIRIGIGRRKKQSEIAKKPRNKEHENIRAQAASMRSELSKTAKAIRLQKDYPHLKADTIRKII